MPRNTRSTGIDAGKPKISESVRAPDLVLGASAGGRESPRESSLERRREKDRRRRVFKAFVYGNFRPRRRASRRVADEHQLLFDWHEPRILYLCLCILLLSCTDALFTLSLLNAGASEANAVMASMLERGIDVFLASKIGMTSISLVILVVAARRKFLGAFSVAHLLQAFCLVYILVIYYELYLLHYVFKLNIP